MNRRSMMKSSAAILTVAAVAPLTLTQMACGSTKQLVKWVGMVISTLRDISPILADMPGAGPIVALIGKAIPIAEKLKKAFEDNDNAETVDLLTSLTEPGGIISQIADLVANLSDSRKALIQGLLATAQVLLRLIAANIESEVPANIQAAIRAQRPAAANAISRAAQASDLEAAFKASRF